MDNRQFKLDTPQRGNRIYCYTCMDWIEKEYFKVDITRNVDYLHIKIICLACECEKVHIALHQDEIPKE